MTRPYSAELLVHELSNDVIFMESQIKDKLSQVTLALVELREENTRLKGALDDKYRNARDFGTQTDDFFLDSPTESVSPPSFREYVKIIMEADEMRTTTVDITTNLPRLSTAEIQNLFPKASTSPRRLFVEPVWNVEESVSPSTSEESGFVHGSADEEWEEKYSTKGENEDSYKKMIEKALLESKKSYAEEQKKTAEHWEVVTQKSAEKQATAANRARTTSKGKITELPKQFLGEWHAVKMGIVDRKTKFEWKKCTKTEHRVKFVKNENGTYTVDHRKFAIKDAEFHEQCSGQRCVVIPHPAKGPTVLLRNASTTYNFVIDNKNLLETFKHDNVEHRIISVKK